MSDSDDTIGEPPDPQLAELATCQEALAEARQESEQHRDALLRARADLENMRKRMAREIDKAHKYGIGRFAVIAIGIGFRLGFLFLGKRERILQGGPAVDRQMAVIDLQ